VPARGAGTLSRMPPPLDLLAQEAARPAELTGLVGLLADLVTALGPWGVALAVAIENVFPPIPSEAVLPFAGFVVARDGGTPWIMVGASTAGSVAGAVLLYELGRRLGLARTRRWLASLPLVEVEEVDRAVAWFDRHGRSSVLLGRCVPIVRSLVSLPAGASGMPRLQFLALTTLGAAAWNTIWVLAGFVLGDRWESAAAYSGVLGNAILVLAALAVARFAWRRRDRIRAGARRPR
jgi:membrane protein DedA with SNARE-associated domain